MNILLWLALLGAPIEPPYEIDLQTTALEYQKILSQTAGLRLQIEADPFLEIIRVGARNLQWQQRVLSAPQMLHQTMPAFSPDFPFVWGPDEILSDYQSFLERVIPEIKNTLEGKGELPTTAPCPVNEFLFWSEQLNFIYQYASRWVLHREYLDHYKANSKRDIRGYYHLSQNPQIENTLMLWRNLSSTEQSSLTPDLIGICRNSGASSQHCSNELEKIIQDTESPLFFYQRYIATAKQTYDSFFAIRNPRKNIRWNSNRPEEAIITMEEPSDAELRDWLKRNIEDEWKNDSWGLHIEFKWWNLFGRIPYVVFQRGVSSHVDKVGGNRITLDQNFGFQSGNLDWTIRHEFGHVLGFPDCYIEFFEEEKNQFVGYNIDPSDLMCARGGRFLDRHYQQLSAAYLRK